MRAIIKFLDGESLPIETEAGVPGRLAFAARPAEANNNRLVYVSMAQVKYITFPDMRFDRGDGADPREARGNEKLVIHFSDGEIVRCFKDDAFSAEGDVYNVRFWDAASGHLVRAMISMHAVKAIFVVERWDSREPVAELAAAGVAAAS